VSELYQQRKALLEQMDQIQNMVPGSLSKQYFIRTRQGKKVRLGPYYKLQLWCQGKNLTRYVMAEELPTLRQAIANHKRFEDLCQQFVDLTVAMGQETPAVKKTKSKRRFAPNVSGKPRPSSG
jgi:hypothetical protein